MVRREKVLELDHIKTFDWTGLSGLDEKMLLGIGVAVEIHPLAADVPEVLAEGEFGCGKLGGIDRVAVNLAQGRAGGLRRALAKGDRGEHEREEQEIAIWFHMCVQR